MSKVFFPTHYIDVPASEPHAPNTAYRVAKGLEHWAEQPAYVYKIQMVYNGAVSGRRSPSYPEQSDDLERVLRALAELRKGGGKSGRGEIQPVGTEPGMSPTEVRSIVEGLNDA